MSETDDKYITFKRGDFLEMVGQWTTQDMSRRQVPLVLAEVELLEINDAVVIRRQDLFASPALATYAAMIGIVASREGDPEIKQNLLDIADYFERQGELAAAEGWHLPTL